MLAALALCADAALSLARRRSRREAGLLLALAIGAAALAAPAAWQTRGYRMTNLDRIAAHLGAAAAPEDLVVVTSYYLSASFDRYYRGPAPWTALPEVADFRFQGFLGVKAKMSREDPIRGELERIASTLRAGHRVWLVGSLRVPAPGSAPPIPPPAPTAESGWSDTPYLDAWSAQAGAVVQREARVVHRVLAPLAGAVNPLENIELLVARPFRSARPAE
jgi:hypothetical protein